MWKPLAYLAILAQPLLAQDSLDLGPSHGSIGLLGRTYASSIGELRWAWSGSGAKVAWNGTACKVRMSARGSIFRVLVDGRESRLDLTSNSDTIHLLAKGLAAGPHLAEIRSITEAQQGTTVFHGFRIQGEPAQLPAAPSRRIEFYGNSITCGYGILDSVAGHPFAPQTEDEGRTFAAQAADSLSAERRTVCWSGRGVVQNYGGDTKNPTLPQLHAQILPYDTQHLWDFSRWVPDVVVIDLGTNDFSTSLPDSARFRSTYAAFVDSLHAHYPNARIVLVDGPMLSDDYPSGQRSLSRVREHLDAIASAQVAKGRKVTHLPLTVQGSLGYGADYHPNLAQATLNGRELAAHLRKVVPDWDRSSQWGIRQRSEPHLEFAASRASIHNPGPAPLRARLFAASGAKTLEVVLLPGSSFTLPPSRTTRWLHLDSPQGHQVLSIAPGLQ